MITPQFILKTLLLTFLLSSMLGAGLGLTLRSLAEPLRNVRLVLVALALSFVAAPGLALLLTRLLPLHPAHATGLILLGCASGAPFLPKLVEVSRGDVTGSIALMTILTLGTTLFLPLALPRLAPGLEASPWAIAQPLLLFILLPLVLGLILRNRNSPLALRWQPLLSRIANISGILMLALLCILNAQSLRAILGGGALLAVALLTLGLFAVGYLVGGPSPRSRALMGITTGSRNVGAAIVPAAQAGPDPHVMTMLVAGTMVMIFVLLTAVAWLRRRPVTTLPAPDARSNTAHGL